MLLTHFRTFYFLLISSPVMLPFAQANGEFTDIDCRNPVGSYEANYCTEQELNRLDATLKQTLQSKLALLSDQTNRVEQLKLAQTRWEDFREAHCDFETSLDFGTGLVGRIMQCHVSLGNQRLEYLQTISKD